MTVPEGSWFPFPAEDGTALQVCRWLPASAPRAVVLVVHGMAEHAARYGELGAALTVRGYAAYAHDQRGHGRSVHAGQAPGHLGDEDSWAHLVDDVHALAQHLAAEHPGLPRLIFGHSMGSLVAQQMLWQHPGDASGFALSGSQGKPPTIATVGRALARLERARLGKAGKSQLINALSFGSFNKPFRPCRTDFDWLSRDEAQVDAYVADPLCGFVLSTQSWVDLLDALPTLTLPDNLARIPKDMPVYALAGARDPVGEMGRSFGDLVDRYRAAWLTRLEVRLYPDGRHEMLHETNRAEVIGELLDWFDSVISRAAAPPGG